MSNLSTVEQTRIKNWLKARGHSAIRVNGKKWRTHQEKVQSIYELHKIERSPA